MGLQGWVFQAVALNATSFDTDQHPQNVLLPPRKRRSDLENDMYLFQAAENKGYNGAIDTDPGT